jgi:hypothetical protein
MAAKDKTPNRTLSVAISQLCGEKDCYEHGTVSKSVNGIVVRRCIGHLPSNNMSPTDELLRAAGLI